MPDQSPGSIRIVFGVAKTICILAGLPLTVICLMSGVGALSASGWARVISAVVVSLGLPLLLVDRLLPEDRTRAGGVPTDVLALFYVAVPLLFSGVAHGLTTRMLAVEGDRLTASGWGRAGAMAHWLGRVRVEPGKPPKPAPTPVPGAGTGSGTGATVKRPDAGARRDAALADARGLDAARAPVKYTPAELFRRCAGSVVNVKTTSGGGTGFLIDDKGTIATNSHVIHNATSVEIKLKDGTWVREVDLLLENEEADLALLRIKHSRLPDPLPLGDSDKCAVGDQVVAIGNPLGLEHTLTDGLVSSRRVYRGRKWLQISVPISPGNSGGPLFDMSGAVVGVTTAGFSAWSGAQNLNLAVPVNELKKQIKKGTYPNRKPIGTNKPQTW